MEQPKHDHNHGLHSSSTNDCDSCADLSTDFDETNGSSDLHPQYLSKQSRRAFLASAGVIAALGTNYSMGFLRGSEEANAETLLAADSIRDAGNIHVLKATPQTCFWGFFDKTLPPVLTLRGRRK